MKLPILFAVLVLGSFVTACDPAKTDDAPVGSWIRMRTSLEMRDHYTFETDGSFAFDENKPSEPQTEDHLRGTYVAADGIVTATATNTIATGEVRLTFSHYAGASRFTSAALLPHGARQGIVGVWTGIRKLEVLSTPGQVPQGNVVEYAFHADGRFRQTRTPFDGSATSVSEGSWLEEAGSTYLLSWNADPANPSGAQADQRLRLLDNAALFVDDEIWERE
jgi:hypothetical protein